jgi:hypothetical protein
MIAQAKKNSWSQLLTLATQVRPGSRLGLPNLSGANLNCFSRHVSNTAQNRAPNPAMVGCRKYVADARYVRLFLVAIPQSERKIEEGEFDGTHSWLVRRFVPQSVS